MVCELSCHVEHVRGLLEFLMGSARDSKEPLRIRASWDSAGWWCETCEERYVETEREERFAASVKERAPREGIGSGTDTHYFKFDAILRGDGGINLNVSNLPGPLEGVTWNLSPSEALHVGKALTTLAHRQDPALDTSGIEPRDSLLSQCPAAGQVLYAVAARADLAGSHWRLGCPEG